MDNRSALTRKHRQEAAQPTSKPPIRITRDKRPQQGEPRRPYSGKIRGAKDSSEIIRVPRKADPSDRPSHEDDPSARNFTVVNVGQDGTLYLKPSRMPPSQFTQAPATPPQSSHGSDPRDVARTGWPATRQSNASGTWTPRPPVLRSTTLDHTSPMPPLSMANVHQRRRTRSRSFSTIDDSVRSPTFDSTDFQILLNGNDATQRPKSSVDLTDGLLGLRIPNYRLGTPRFSERGTAYLHNSIMTATTDGMRSSVFSRAEYDKLFPAPPGGHPGPVLASRHSSASFLHPSTAAYSLTPTRTPPTPPVKGSFDGISAHMYDEVEANINAPSLVRYSPATGKIVAASAARLIAQITSPLFLDYELLADFFLTFRNFLSYSDLLEYLLARMKWAFVNNSDAGRIVRVRTFVALRHWILNYFADDFFTDFSFRERFCSLVNDLAQTLRKRLDRGGSDINVIGELKKCWRRTCAIYWPISDALDTSPDADILPGGHESPIMDASATSLPLTTRNNGARMDFRRSSSVQLPMEAEKAEVEGVIQAFGPNSGMHRVRIASIPTSPLSDLSATVLCCSVPFLRNMLPSKEKPPRPAGPQRNPPLSAKPGPMNRHKRSGSFTDALRDKRSPLPSGHLEAVDIRSLPQITFTGGLVRGLLLQPSPSKVDILVPLSPTADVRELRPGGEGSTHSSDRQHVGVRKIVGDVRRALSTRRVNQESSSSSHRSTNSSSSHNSSLLAQSGQPGNPPSWQQLRGQPRVDVLGEKIEGSYKEAFEDNLDPVAADSAPGNEAVEQNEVEKDSSEWPSAPQHSQFDRMNSHVTTGSRSIVIVDDTGLTPEMPSLPGALPSVSSWSSGMAPKPLFRSPEQAFEAGEMSEYDAGMISPKHISSQVHPHRTSEPTMQDLLMESEEWQTNHESSELPSGYSQARKSSSLHPSALDMVPTRNQLRRRPGGDLKAADHVHDLDLAPRPHTGGSYSTFTQSLTTSGVPSNELSGTHFSRNDFNNWRLPSHVQQSDSLTLLQTHSSQPNMRPSFERQVSHLTRLREPSQDQGIEDALAKLEGKAPSPTPTESTVAERNVDSGMSTLARQKPRSAPLREIGGDRTAYLDDFQLHSPRTETQGASIYHMSGSYVESEPFVSEETWNGGGGLKSPSPEGTSELPMQGTEPTPPLEQTILIEDRGGKAEHVREPSSAGKSDSEIKSGTPQSSFLLDDNESLSDISTEIADQSGDESLGVRSFFFDDTVDEDAMHISPYQPPPTPPSTVGPPPGQSPERSPGLQPPALDVQKRPLKEAASAPKLFAPQPNPEFRRPPGELRRVRTSPSRQHTAHLPFVLAFESDVIAEQLTIIEKDALDEVDWKDLISLSWRQKPSRITNWVDFLKQDESNGIDIVITRFNLVVKWVVSECVLTEAPSERARCITKYIHIAMHCHRLRNFASMYQITLALLSSDLARLHKTWVLVAPTEKQKLERLEKLCQPLRNFHHLRVEMESVSAETGCIPFIGLYTHDLTFNAQKPARTEPTPPSQEPLINFERFQTAATIVKSLLGLIETSSKYIFHPHPEVLSRCLWLAALNDKEIAARSKGLE